MTDLNTLIAGNSQAQTVTLSSAYGINDTGYILATGTDYVTGAQRTFVLVPN
jgi:hypothetical protein